MNSRKLLIYFSIIYAGDWDKIHNACMSKEQVDEKEAEKVCSNLKSKVVTILDDNYPEALKPIFKPPHVLFYHGNLKLIQEKRKCLSVVGSRQNTQYGEESTNYLVSNLSKDVVIVSGMALGIDGIAHRAAIESGGKTVAVLGCGINVCYPLKNLDIYNELKKKHLIISEYPDLTPPIQDHFPVRNRIVAALSCCTLIPEGLISSGTSITATLCLQMGGEICCVPAPIRQNSLCNHLIAHGAYLVETPEDVLYVMGYSRHRPIFENENS